MSTLTELYGVVSKYSLICPALVCAPSFFFDAPFGRFSPSKPSVFLVDGIKSWIFMETVSPACFLAAFLSSPLTRSLTLLKTSPLAPPPMFSHTSFLGTRVLAPNPPTLLALLFLIHYANRSWVSPLRTPVRSKFHISVPISSIIFNVVNGTLMGACMSALATPAANSGTGTSSPTLIAKRWFWIGIGMWAVGFVSNIWHDEILLNIRRVPKPASGKGKDEKPHYAIPYGGLYALISYPNYASEWFEWLGFAIATSALTSQLPSTHVVFPFSGGRLGLGALSNNWLFEHLTPPWLFFIAEVLLMFPRAWSGHKWYHKKFPDYPRERKCVVPFVL